MSENDQQVITPPTPLRVAKRALALSAVVCRSGIETDVGNRDAEQFREDVLNWLYDLGLSDEIESEEFDLLNSPLGTSPERASINASWRGEGMAVLAWALNIIELHPHDQLVDAPMIAESLGFLKDVESTVLHNPQLRSFEDLNRFAESMLSLHWRLRQYSLDHASMNFVDFAKTCYFGPLELHGLRFVENDLAIGDRTISKASEETWRECLSIAQERHIAANWLIGNNEVYSQVTTDT
jgi:hypothetical protein